MANEKNGYTKIIVVILLTAIVSFAATKIITPGDVNSEEIKKVETDYKFADEEIKKEINKKVDLTEFRQFELRQDDNHTQSEKINKERHEAVLREIKSLK